MSDCAPDYNNGKNTERNRNPGGGNAGRAGSGSNHPCGAGKIERYGMLFDCRAEAERWSQLSRLQRSGAVTDLERRKRYEILPEHREPDTVSPDGRVQRGKLIEPAYYFTADFFYRDSGTAEPVVECLKGYQTPEFPLKKALMYDRYGIRVREV